MSRLPLDPFDWALLGVSLCLLLLLAGLARSWSIDRRLLVAQAELEARAAEQDLLLGELRQRLESIETVTEAQVTDARTRHDEDVVEVLDSLLRLNESLRPPSAVSTRSGEAS